MLKAKIEDFNISTYSSVLPKDLRLVPIDQAQQFFFHGAVLEVILAGIGITYSAGAAKRNIGIRTHGRNYIVDSADAVMAAASCVGMQTEIVNSNKEIVGGYVAEYVDTFPTHVGKDAAQNEAKKQLEAALDHICNIRSLDPTSGTRTIAEVSYLEVDSTTPHGYTLNGYGFLSFGIRPAAVPSFTGT